jgi:DNA-binding LacI/PurR family transcriptional regulator
VAFGRCRISEHFPHIGVDGKTGVKQMTSHLIEKGHKQIAFIGASSALTLQIDRFAGFCEGLQDHGINVDYDLVVEGNLTRQGGYAAAQRLLTRPVPPTAIICVNDLTAIGAMRAAHEAGFKIGSDLVIAGFDGIEEAEHTQPPLTTLSQPVYEIACQLVQMLIKVISSTPLENAHRLLQPRPIFRASTEG